MEGHLKLRLLFDSLTSEFVIKHTLKIKKMLPQKMIFNPNWKKNSRKSYSLPFILKSIVKNNIQAIWNYKVWIKAVSVNILKFYIQRALKK